MTTFEIYANGSKDDLGVGCSAVSNLCRSRLRHPNDATNISAEVNAIKLQLTTFLMGRKYLLT